MNYFDVILTYRLSEDMGECLHSLFQGTCPCAVEWNISLNKITISIVLHLFEVSIALFWQKYAEQPCIPFYESSRTDFLRSSSKCVEIFNFSEHFGNRMH